MSVGVESSTDRSRSDCVHEQVAKLGPVSRAAGMDCECVIAREGCRSIKKGVIKNVYLCINMIKPECRIDSLPVTYRGENHLTWLLSRNAYYVFCISVLILSIHLSFSIFIPVSL